ncbi:MAG: hypothetical protein U0974_01705 [Gemmatimonadales bacterium]|nr:hypothetical protein [Gemmatimonadales bacterium]MDZ4388432.1 hypothetical protein [Gemmatimonadales bacterium]
MAEQRLDRATRSVVRSLSLVRSGAPAIMMANVVEPLPAPSRFAGCPAPVLLPQLFAPRARWSASAAGVVLADQPEYLISRLDADGRRIGRIANPVPLRRVTRAEALDEVQRIPAGALAVRDCGVPPEALADAAGSATVHQAIGELALAPDGVIWVRRAGTVNGPERIDLYDSDGAPLGWLPSTTPFPAAFVNAESYVTLRVAEDGQVDPEWVRIRRPE